ncbi:DUF2000 family protein [Pendulispora albinea]|uniref:DUF2000 domain-containing protein n=1 Tax=Pendulispora albinea TaxID=2741071 RepID=A0ABZ2M966_9BACT
MTEVLRAHQRSRRGMPGAASLCAMKYDTKIAIAVRDDLAAWQKLNVTAFLASGVAIGIDEVAGEPYEDAAGRRYLALFRQPVLVYAGSYEALSSAHARALERGLSAAIYTDEMFVTNNDVDNRAAVRSADPKQLRLAGIAIYGPRGIADKAFKGLRLHE